MTAGAGATEGTVATLRRLLAAEAAALRVLMAFLGMLRTTAAGAGILVTLEILRRAGRGLLRVVEARELAAMEVLADDPLEAAQFGVVLARDEGDGGAGGERAARAADAVDVVLERVGEVEVHHVRDAVDVDAAGGDVGGDKDADLAVLEGLQGALALALRAVGVDGGARDIRAGCDVLVATPGRLLDLGRQGHGNFGALEYLVLDEADRMLDMGFLPAINTIVRALPKERQTLLFSATLSREIESLTSQFQRSPKILEIGRRSNPAETVTQLLFECPGALKQVMLHHLLKDEALKMVLVFARTKHGADRICRKLQGADISCAAIHANRSQSQRQRALQAFKNGEIRVLVATDIASRGIDVDGITHVFNFDFPDQLEDYVHRIGRTGRALATGTAITFVTREDLGELRRLERIVGKHLHCGKLPGFDYTQQAPARTPEDFQRHQDPRAGAHHSEREGRPQGGRHGGYRASQGNYRPFGRPGTRRQGGPK